MNREFNQIAGANRTLNLQVARQIAVKILSGDLQENSIIPGEMKLCEQLGVSRTALREAIKLLTSKGLLDSRPKVGTRVCPKTNWNFLDPQLLGWLSETSVNKAVYGQFEEIRKTVEPEAAAMAATKADSATIENFTLAFDDLQRLARQKDTEQWDVNAWLDACATFYKTLYTSTGNCFFSPFSNLIIAMFNWYREFNQITDDLHLEDFEALFTAIKDKNAKDAKAASQHLLAFNLPGEQLSTTNLAAV